MGPRAATDVELSPRAATRGYSRAVGGAKEINGGNLLIAMYREPDSYAVYLLEEQGITRFDVVNYVSHGVSKIPPKKSTKQRQMKIKMKKASRHGG